MITSTYGTARRHARLISVAGVASVLVILAALLVTCGGGDARAAASCDSIAQIQSYRYTINLKLDSPAFDPAAPAVTPAATFGVYTNALAALFSDLKLDGAFQAPDRSQAILKFNTQELELREVGDKSWIRIDTTWHEQDSTTETPHLTPDVLCGDVVEEIAPSLDDVESDRETINSVETEHYRLNEADLSRLPALLGARPGTDIPDKYQVDVWVEREGRFPVRLEVSAQDKDEQGRPIGLNLLMEFRDINDPAIEIESPGGPAG